jgi:hypothetical protein
MLNTAVIKMQKENMTNPIKPDHMQTPLIVDMLFTRCSNEMRNLSVQKLGTLPLHLLAPSMAYKKTHYATELNKAVAAIADLGKKGSWNTRKALFDSVAELRRQEEREEETAYCEARTLQLLGKKCRLCFLLSSSV